LSKYAQTSGLLDAEPRVAWTGVRAAIAGGTYAGEVLGLVMAFAVPRRSEPVWVPAAPPAVPTRLALVGALAPDAASSDAPPGDLYS